MHALKLHEGQARVFRLATRRFPPTLQFDRDDRVYLGGQKLKVVRRGEWLVRLHLDHRTTVGQVAINLDDRAREGELGRVERLGEVRDDKGHQLRPQLMILHLEEVNEDDLICSTTIHKELCHFVLELV